MKNTKLIFTSILMSALFFMTSMVVANSFGVVTNIQVVDEDNGHKSISIRIPYSNTPKIMVKLEDAEGMTLYSKKSKGEDGVATLLSVNSLPSGMYYITVEDNYKITKHPFRIELDKVVMNDYKMETLHKPVIQYNSRRQLVLLNVEGEGDIEVEIQNEYGDQLLATDSTNQFEKVFNLKRLENGTYTFVTRYGGKTFYEDIIIR
ncbi:MAG: hypothetical protein ACPGVB_05865 [Chitinophagales bacterium]